MKKLIIVCLCISSIQILQAQEKIELTKTDLFTLSRLPASHQLSLMGISIGDSLDKAIKKLGKSKKDIRIDGTNQILDYGDEYCRYVSRDNKVITSIIIFPNFKDKMVGKTSEFFGLMSPERMKKFLSQYIGGPEYIYELDVMGWFSFIYSSGLAFRKFGDENAIAIEDQVGIDREINDPNTKKIDDYDKPIKKPGVSSSAGFRNALWGMTKDQARKTESSEFIKETRLEGDLAGLDLLTYKTDALGMNSFIVYYFAGDALTRARYLITESHSDYNLYIRDYDKIKGQLTERYGAPARDQKIWSNELFKGNPAQYGLAIASGHVTYVAEWYPTETSIQLLMRGDNFEVNIHVEYMGEKFAEYEKDFIKRSKDRIW